MDITPVTISEKLNSFSEHWTPKIIGSLNGQHVKVAKLKGEFVMHHHDNEDELFMVIKGVLHMKLENKTIVIHQGEFVIIPKGVKHMPYAEEEVELLLFEPASTLNTGNELNELTKRNLDQI